jgi:nodulation protein E
MQRVVITGMGAVTPLGHTATTTWSAMREGRVAIGPITSMSREGLRFGIAAEVQGFDPLAHFDEKKLILFDRVSQFALVAAREAVAQSGIDFAADGLGENTAVIIGTGIGGEQTHDEASRRLYGENNPRTHPLTIVRLMANAPACHVSIEHRLTGPTFATVSACSYVGQPDSNTPVVLPSDAHSSSAMCGAKGLTSWISGRTSSMCGVRSPERMVFMYSIIAAMAVL